MAVKTRPGRTVRTAQAAAVTELVTAGWSYRQAAKALGMSTTTAWRWHHRTVTGDHK